MNFFSKYNDIIIKNVLVLFVIEVKNIGKVFMLYGDGDYVLIGDYVIIFFFIFFIRVYVGSELDEGFNFVVVSFVLFRLKWCIIYSWFY